jgi:glycosyltransferase involved in cell wall biosynthesis
MKSISSWLYVGVTDSVGFWGVLKRYEDVARIMSSGTVFVNPSIFEGMTVLEAMAAGTSVVAYDLEGYRECTQNGVNCLLAPRDDFEQSFENVKSIVIHPEIARNTSEAGIETAKQFSWEKITRRLRSAYLPVVG